MNRDLSERANSKVAGRRQTRSRVLIIPGFHYAAPGLRAAAVAGLCGVSRRIHAPRGSRRPRGARESGDTRGHAVHRLRTVRQRAVLHHPRPGILDPLRRPHRADGSDREALFLAFYTCPRVRNSLHATAGSPWLPPIRSVRLDTDSDPGEYPHRITRRGL